MKKFLLAGLVFGGVVFAQPKIEVKDAWVREVPPTSKMSAAYMIIENKGNQPDKLVDAKNNASEITELHETVEGKMRKVKAIEVPANGKTELKPGGLHVMLINLKKPLKEGETVELVLKFEKSGEVKVNAPVKKGMGGHKQGH
ncbi:MAG: copper chaperone PCu(A)C [Aquificaceae bacterium]|nr:copper chaperone PCu(A)C [Aquificaceae bacterium]MCS7196794.1 copper chaperone PCu(A)C [Aquificaceae bacterium]MDW8032380.1 copper chaperone PCu(A)C [Aquificaceae bacterium]MDW8294316.1 copper chaperone PCu(A)C [Aquificaceae bacterium]